MYLKLFVKYNKPLCFQSTPYIYNNTFFSKTIQYSYKYTLVLLHQIMLGTGVLA